MSLLNFFLPLQSSCGAASLIFLWRQPKAVFLPVAVIYLQKLWGYLA